MDEFVVGRKAIIEYLRSALDLSHDHDTAWNKIRRWKRNYGMAALFHSHLNGQPYIIVSEVREWITANSVMLERVSSQGVVKGGYRGDDTEKEQNGQ